MAMLRRLLGEALRRERLAQRRTLREVSSAARVSLGYLSEVERGQKEASSELLASICEALEVRLSNVLREVSDDLAIAETGDLESVPAGAVAAPAELTPAGLASTTAVGRAVRPAEVNQFVGPRAKRPDVAVNRVARPLPDRRPPRRRGPVRLPARLSRARPAAGPPASCGLRRWRDAASGRSGRGQHHLGAPAGREQRAVGVEQLGGAEHDPAGAAHHACRSR